jgi:hypothetical protein
MPTPDRPQAPGYLANLMARLFHEVSGEGLTPLGIAPAQFPLLIELWFGDAPVSRESLQASQEMGADEVEALVDAMVAAGMVVEVDGVLRLTGKGEDAKGPAVAAARRANAAAAGALSEDEMVAFVGMMNRVIDALLGAKA